MSPQRTQAYRRVVHTLNELGPSKLLSSEQERIREAADTLIFSGELIGDPAAVEALDDAERLTRTLVESGRWTHLTAMRLADDVRACGPDCTPELTAA